MDTGLLLNLAPTGMVPIKEMNPNVPLQPAEIIADAVACAAHGVNILHIHARDEIGHPTYRKEIYARIIGGIREKCPDLIICVSLSGRNFSAFAHRSDPLLLRGDLRPDMASLTLSSLNFSRTESVNSPETIRRLAETMLENDIKPELEAFDAGMVHYAAYMADKGWLHPPFYFNFLLGNVSSAQATPAHLALMISELPPASRWAAGGLGADQLKASTLGIIFGHGARIGLEDYLWLDEERQMLGTNEAMVKRTVELARLMGKSFAPPNVARRMLGIADV